MSQILRFDEPGSDDKARVGGKGVNLGLCAQQGFPVPPGFTVTTDAYGAFLVESGLDTVIARTLEGADYGDATDLEARTASIREAIIATPLPEGLASQIIDAYAALGDDTHVAVRSSGTAEDLAEASFAGIHDTFLNVHGADAVQDAVRRCWASLWTARAAAYRHTRGLNDIAGIRMAVVVQEMVEPDVSGVVFTANPITTATDEVVINASWGLGEAVVQGFVTPDEYVVKAHRPTVYGFDVRLAEVGAGPTLKIKARTTGTKEQRMVRDPETGQGNIIEDVPAAQRAALTLSDEQAIELADLARRVQAFYEQIPQDIEWALRDGKFYLLQSRAITGVEFDWAADMDSFQWAPDNSDHVWTLAFTEIMTGAKSPLYYHWVTEGDSAGYHSIGNLLNIPELSGPSFTNGGADINRTAQLQVHKYYRGEVYYNTEVEKIISGRLCLPELESDFIPWRLPEKMQRENPHRFSYRDFLKGIAKINLWDQEYGIWGQLDWIEQFIDSVRPFSDYTKLPDMTTLSDAELKRAIDEQWQVCIKMSAQTWILWMVWCPQMMRLFERMVTSWYTGPHKDAVAELLQGVNARSKTLEENLWLYELSEKIRASDHLNRLFTQHPGAEFFTALDDSEEGRQFLRSYREFLAEHGHRGSEDRCFSYPRRWEDSTGDYRSLQLLLSRDRAESPLEAEHKLAARREAVYEDVMRNLKRAPITGALKAEAFTRVYDWAQRFMSMRDDERWAYEMSVLCAKLYCRELGRRCVQRGILLDAEDFVMFTKDELFDLLDGRSTAKLAQAKALQRRKDHNLALERKQDLPYYMRDGRPLATSVVEGTSEGAGGLAGTGWTSGTVTATARVVYRLSEIDRVKPGEILVCQSTDPGWTPVFMILSGIVIESGGVLAHAVCLSREYGLPAVQLPGARKAIPDGATITINGATGEIVIVDEGTGGASADEAAVAGDVQSPSESNLATV